MFLISIGQRLNVTTRGLLRKSSFHTHFSILQPILSSSVKYIKRKIHFPVYALCIRRTTADGGTRNGPLSRRELEIKQDILKAPLHVARVDRKHSSPASLCQCKAPN
ncbi:hypothetical protein GHT06_008578 [Daphnia sinensis]|uniref:Uncharacterized protein n=1 Tax=Daphnia sinensis TaxID=1820382 RepID=A0AAD5LLC8_9CRUS|nr:hypothetical protein GHT06_008578 [Daphnia sinensis]